MSASSLGHWHFLLESYAAQRLYRASAASQPIMDYHSHLSPEDIAENRGFLEMAEIWLAGVHHKRRAMTACGVS